MSTGTYCCGCPCCQRWEQDHHDSLRQLRATAVQLTRDLLADPDALFADAVYRAPAMEVVELPEGDQ